MTSAYPSKHLSVASPITPSIQCSSATVPSALVCSTPLGEREFARALRYDGWMVGMGEPRSSRFDVLRRVRRQPRS